MPNPIFALGIYTLAKVSLGSQSSNLFFVGYHCDVSVQIGRRGKYKWREIHGTPSEQVFRLLCITISLLPNIWDHLCLQTLCSPNSTRLFRMLHDANSHDRKLVSFEQGCWDRYLSRGNRVLQPLLTLVNPVLPRLRARATS